MALYSMAVLRAPAQESSDYLATRVDCTSSRSASTLATTAAVAVTTAKVTIAKASPMRFKPSVSAILAHLKTVVGHGKSLNQLQRSAETPHPFLNPKNAGPTFNSVAMKKLLLLPENMIPLS